MTLDDVIPASAVPRWINILMNEIKVARYRGPRSEVPRWMNILLNKISLPATTLRDPVVDLN